MKGKGTAAKQRTERVSLLSFCFLSGKTGQSYLRECNTFRRRCLEKPAGEELKRELA